ncbi:MAG: tetratricopeptide repeat protein [Planctomycetaceae bacterium]|nr:tetratricopeptide repeat protein [Planctomycetaceae bacterium]
MAIFFSGTVSFADAVSDSLNSAKQLYNQQKYEQARVALEDFLRIYPTHSLANEAKFFLADSFLYLKKYDSAINLYSQLTNLGDENPLTRSVLFRIGEAYYTKGDYVSALPLLMTFVKKFPFDSYLQYALYYLGYIEMNNNQPEAAEHYFNESIRLFPNGDRQLECRIGLASAKNQLGKITESDTIFNELLRSTDQNTVELTTYQYGVALYERNKITDAIALLTSFLSRWQNSTLVPEVQRVLTRCYVDIKDNEKALQIISLIVNPSVEDNLMKARLLIRLKRTDEAEALLQLTERRTDAPQHFDEITFLKASLQYFKKNWQATINLLEPVLLPRYSNQNQYSAAGNNNTNLSVAFGYTTTIARTDKQNMSDEVFLYACAFLALSYAQLNDKNRANAILNEMNGNVANTNQSDWTKIVNDTSQRLQKIYTAKTDTNNNDTLAALNTSAAGQWNPSASAGRSHGNRGQISPSNLNNNLSNNRTNNSTNTTNNRAAESWNGSQYNRNTTASWQDSPPSLSSLSQSLSSHSGSSYSGSAVTKPPVTTGSDLERFWVAFDEFGKRAWGNAAAQLDQILNTKYFAQSKSVTINYNGDGTQGTLDAATFAKACSMLVLARGNLGETEKAAAILTAFANKLSSSNNTQQTVWRETQTQLNEIIRKNNSNNFNTETAFAKTISESEQQRIIKECNSLFNAKRYEQVESKLGELMRSDLAAEVLSAALLLRGRALLSMGNEREGVKMLERIKSEFVTSTQYKDALWNLGLYYEMSGDSMKSVEYFQVLIDEFPNYKEIDGALYYVAMDDIENGNGRKGVTYLLRIYRNYQAGQYWSHAAWSLAYEEYKKKNYAQSEVYLQKALQHPPDYAVLDRVLYLSGEIALQKGDYSRALLAFQELINLCPDSNLRRNADRSIQTATRATSNNIR